MDELNVANNEVPNQTNGYVHNNVDSSYSEWDVSKGSSFIGTLNDNVSIDSNDGNQTITNDGVDGDSNIDDWADDYSVVNSQCDASNYSSNKSKNFANNGPTNGNKNAELINDSWGNPINSNNRYTGPKNRSFKNDYNNDNLHDSWGNEIKSNKNYNGYTRTEVKNTYQNGYQSNGYNNETSRDSWGNERESKNYESNRNRGYQSRQAQNGYHNNGYNNEASHDSWENEVEPNNFESNRNRGYQSRQGQGMRKSFDRKPNNFANNGEDGNHVNVKPLPKPTYVPPEFEETNEFTIEVGSTFGKYDEIEVKVSGMDVPKNITSFQNAGLREVLLENLVKCHHITPTPIQKYALPIIMSGRDMIASAQTGSGKTAAFILPILNNLLSEPSELIVDHNHCEPQVLIMSPTRELAIQICEVATRLSRGTIIKCELLYGGTATYHQKAKILRGVHIIVGTLGRLTDFANRGLITFSSLRYVVLDEADRMLDMGFQLDVERILSHETMVSPAERTTVMFSATLPENVQYIAKSYLKSDYISVGVGEVGGACKDVTQQIELVTKFDKKKELINVLQKNDDCQGTIVFVEQKRQADFIAAFLSEMDYPTTSIHGDREQAERELALRDFKTKNMKILVATSVASRGLDIKGVKMVINFDLPKTIEEYVHRIGRTGRLGNSGQAISFFDPEQDAQLAPYLVNSLQKAEQEIPEFLSTYSSNGKHLPSSHDQFNDIRTDVTVTSEYLVDEDW